MLAALLSVVMLASPLPAGHSPRECATPSIDRYQQWIASGEGTTVPATGSMLVPARHGPGYAAKINFLNDEWHVAVLWLANEFEAQVDLSRSHGFRLTYSATDDVYLQLRPASHWSGGAQWATRVPSTHGRTVTRFFSFRPSAWGPVTELGTPAHTFATALSEARGFVFVGKTPNKLEFRGLKVDRYTPPCL
ncbi:hypothetical protein Aab01nite_76640 [Paractinoplanes abujensis]|uniref:Uncharacterized protein n=1 Tax=Paractinoplanes abujensis TaxID=882441 RepID=A0A7W7CSE9_9ACTN|nr:hypothetical protein [Actinoplanes abujensis]MBB4692448.1 hypothetical protein [Actinoplanes abujensis]GID24074.1 hypothetical protein Aab01nite_76640 [Actinoplanes abujensis]